MLGWGRIGDIKLRQDKTTSYALIDFFDVEAKRLLYRSNKWYSNGIYDFTCD